MKRVAFTARIGNLLFPVGTRQCGCGRRYVDSAFTGNGKCGKCIENSINTGA